MRVAKQTFVWDRRAASSTVKRSVWKSLAESIETASKVVGISAAIVGIAVTLYQAAAKAHQERVAQSITFFQALRANPSHAAVVSRLVRSQTEGLRLAEAATTPTGMRAYIEFSKKLAYGENEADFWELLEQYQIAAVCIQGRLCDCKSLVAFVGEEARRTRVWLTSAIAEKRTQRNEPSVGSGLDFIVLQAQTECTSYFDSYQTLNRLMRLE